jgi:hypothetical protein
MNFADALTAIRWEDARLEEHRVAVNRLTIEPSALLAGERRFRLTTRGLERLCDRFGHRPKVPAGYLASLPDGLQTDLLRLHLKEGLEGGESISLFARESELVGIGRADLARLPGVEVMEAVAEGLGGKEDELEIIRYANGGEALWLDLVTYRAESEVKRGDIVRGGVHVEHSLTGDFATRVEGYLHRLACTNGAIHRECMGARRTPRTRRLPATNPRARQQQREQVRTLVADALAKVSGRLRGLERLTTERVDFEHLGENWLRRSRLSPQRLMPLLRRAYAEEGAEGTAYDALNAFTRVATHDHELSPSIREILARLGGMLALGHSRLCPRCWSLVAASN